MKVNFIIKHCLDLRCLSSVGTHVEKSAGYWNVFQLMSDARHSLVASFAKTLP